MNHQALEPRTNQSELEPTRASAARRAVPQVDIFENSEGFLIVADLPGVEADALRVEYNPPELSVAARAYAGSSTGELSYERRFELGSGVDPESISAELKQGVLRIGLKKVAAHKPRRIDVRAS